MAIKQVLLTGNSGFVGTLLAQELIRVHDFEVLGVDRVMPKKQPSERFSFQQIDLSTSEWVNQLDFKADLIIHCAAAKGDFGIAEDEYHRDNVEATAQVIRYAERVGCEKIIYYSTVSAYGHKPEPCYEDGELNPKGAYGETKFEGDLLLNAWLEKHPEGQLITLRPSVIYGIDNYANMYNLLYTLDRAMPISIGGGNHIKSMISVNNMVDINLHVVGMLEQLPRYAAYICVDQPYLPLKEVMKIMAEVDGINTPKIKIPVNLAYFLAIPFELLSKITGKDFKVTFERIHKFNTSTDYRSNQLEKIGYKQRYSTRDEILKMALWYKNISK